MIFSQSVCHYRESRSDRRMLAGAALLFVFYIKKHKNVINSDILILNHIGKLTANTDLSLYTLLVLTLRTEPSVYYSVSLFPPRRNLLA